MNNPPAERAQLTPVGKWVAGARPKTLGAAIAPVVVGTAAATIDGPIRWARAIAALVVALALRMLKASMNAADDGLAGIQQLAGDATLLYYMTEEAQEGKNAYLEKRKPDFDQYPKRP